MLCCLGLSLVLGACERFETRDVLGTVLRVEGKAALVHKGKSTVLAPLALFGAGDQLRTEPEGKVTILLVPGAHIVLDAKSELEVEQLQIHKLGAAGPHAVRARNARVRLARGSLCASLVKAEVRPHIRLYVNTPAGTIEGSAESIFFVHVNEALTHVLCAGGTISLISAAQRDAETLSAGYAQNWENEKPTSSPKQVVGDVTLAGELQTALAAAAASDELEDSRRQIIPGFDQP